MSYVDNKTLVTEDEIRQSWGRSGIGSIERAMHADHGDEQKGQKLGRLFNNTQGNLLNAAESIALAPKPVIRILTGFYIEKAKVAETDGILAAAQMAYFFKLAGIDCCVTTDQHCEAICRVALAESGCPPEMLEVISDLEERDMKNHINAWKVANVTHAIAIERPGPSFSDGRPYNMRGEVIENCAPLHSLFNGGDWKTIGIVDRGNEIGSGFLKGHIIAEDIRNGEQIACKTGADYLLVSRVSNWGANALTAAVALLGPRNWPQHLGKALDAKALEKTLTAMVKAGAVDGITLERNPANPTVDALPVDRHVEITRSFLKAVKCAVEGRGVALRSPDSRSSKRGQQSLVA